MKSQILLSIVFLGLICSSTINATESTNSVVDAKQMNEKIFATFGEDTIYFSNQASQVQFVKMTKKYRAYQQYSEKISIDLMNTLKEARTELSKIRDAATNDKVCDTKRESSYLTKLKNQLGDMFEASTNIRNAYNHVSQIEIAIGNMSLSSEDTGERSRYWDECKDAFNNCIDAIKDARKDIDTKRDEYYAQIINVIESKKSTSN